IIDENGNIIVPKDTEISRNVVEVLNENRHLFRKEIISKEKSLQNLTSREILATTLPDGGEMLYAKENIFNLKTGEVIVKKNEAITEEVLSRLRENRQSLMEEVITYFLEDDVYVKELDRSGVFAEVLDVYVFDDNGDRSQDIRIIGNDQR